MTCGPNDMWTKWPADKMICKQNDLLSKCLDGKIMLTEWPVDKMTHWQNDLLKNPAMDKNDGLTKWLVKNDHFTKDEFAKCQTTKWPIRRMTGRQNDMWAIW